MTIKKLDWLEAKCPECGKTYHYLALYKPATCNKFDCAYKHLHPELHRRGVIERNNNNQLSH